MKLYQHTVQATVTFKFDIVGEDESKAEMDKKAYDFKIAYLKQLEKCTGFIYSSGVVTKTEVHL